MRKGRWPKRRQAHSGLEWTWRWRQKSEVSPVGQRQQTSWGACAKTLEDSSRLYGRRGRTALDTVRATWIPLISDTCHGNRACRPRPGVGRGAGVLSKEEVERDSFGRVTDFDLYLICTQIKPFGILTLISTGSVLVSERGLPRLPTGPRR